MTKISVKLFFMIMALLGVGGILGWIVNGFKMKAEVVMRKDCDGLRSSCSHNNAEAFKAIWNDVKSLGNKIDALGDRISDALVEIARNR